MMKHLLMCMLFPLFLSHAQDNDTLKFFPYKTGDMWEYYWDDPQYPDTLQNFCIKDSIDAQGDIYVTQSARFINPIKPPALLGSNVNYRIDTAYNVYGPPTDYSQGNQVILYKLNAKQGDQWIIWTYEDSTSIYGYELCRVTKVWTGSLFGRVTIFKAFDYYYGLNSKDTLGLDRYSDILAEYFGLYSRGSGDAIGDIYLKGAVVDGILYGDTTFIVTGVNVKPNSIVNNFKLYQNYPNPFNPTTVISYQLSVPSHTTLTVYDILGRKIKTLVTGLQQAGMHVINFNSANLSSGIYFYELKTKTYLERKKMVFLR